MSETTAPRPVSFAALVQQFFTEYLVTQRALSPRTIASYRDAMLFLDFARKRLGKMPTAFNLADTWLSVTRRNVGGVGAARRHLDFSARPSAAG